MQVDTGPVVSAPLSRRADSPAPRRVVCGWEPCEVLRDRDESGGGWLDADSLASREGGHGRTRASYAQQRVGCGSPAEWEVWGHRRLVPAQCPDLQPAECVEASGLTRRFVRGVAKAARFLVLHTVGKVGQHARRTLVRLTSAGQHALVALARRHILALNPT